MFFASSGSAAPAVERALLDGTRRTTLVDSKIVYPYGVALDHPNRSEKKYLCVLVGPAVLSAKNKFLKPSTIQGKLLAYVIYCFFHTLCLKK